MGSYLLTLLINTKLDDSERKELLASITKNFGKLTKDESWGSRELAYPIKKQDQAFYVHFEFEAEPKNISSLDKNLKLNEDVIRYLLIKR